MGLIPQFTKAQVARAIKQKVDAYREASLQRLKIAGEQFVNLARQVNTYTDQTGNLRSSIGYMILYNGQIKAQNFEGNKQEGKSNGKRIAQQLANSHPGGFILVGVAGMDYAAAVEAKGKDVITDTSRIVRKLLKRSLKELNRNMNG